MIIMKTTSTNSLLAFSKRCLSSQPPTKKKAGSRLQGPQPSFKYFINRSTVLKVYRESLQLCRKGFSDPQTSQDMKEMIQHEFEPFRKYKGATEASEAV